MTRILRPITVVAAAAALSAAFAVTTGKPEWGWATFIIITALGAIIATATAGKGRP